MAGIKPMEAAQLIANEWNALTESEKQVSLSSHLVLIQ